MSDDTTNDATGTTPEPLGDRYEIGGILGRGGMADVRVGRDLRLGRTVAIKQLRADLAADETFQERFRREAQSAASLNHPSIVAVYDTGEAPDIHGDTIPYIVMEIVEGRTLRDIMREGRKILPERALSITADILSALDYSHRAGIVHRDIKPANVMLTPEGKVKVMDFGIARAIADASSAMTQTAAVIGTAQYLSPEQARGETVDARSDIYSTGCVLYELLTGRPPFVGDSPVSVAYQHVREEARPPSQLNPDVSVAIDHIVAKALAKRVDDRYSSAADMRRDIEQVLAGGTVDAPTQLNPVVPAAGATAVGATAVAAPLPPPDLPASDRDDSGGKGKWWALALLLLALAAAIGFVLWQAGQDDDPPASLVSVPNVQGESEDNARAILTRNGLEVGEIRTRTDADIPEGQAIATDPAAGDRVEEGSSVDIIMSVGVDRVTIPDLEGLSFDRAKSILEGEDYGFTVERQNIDSSEPRDRVINTDPPRGSQVPKGSTVTVLVSRGQTEVPQFTGLTRADAETRAEEANIELSFTEAESDTVPAGTVVSQNPPAGSQVNPGSTVTLVVSSGPAEVPEPTEPTEPPVEPDD